VREGFLLVLGWLGPSSTWAFSQQVLNIFQDYLGQHLSPEVPLNVDANAFKLNWPSTRTSPPQLSTDIPSLDHAIYLTNTVKFHLSQIYHLFDEETFMMKLATFYDGDPTIEPASELRLWYVQFLLIMAFGKALLVPGNSEQSLPGSGLVSRALELLPDVHGLFQDPISSIEILCCLALYLQSIDHRNSAYTYVSWSYPVRLPELTNIDWPSFSYCSYSRLASRTIACPS
jgi:proline utilization trans-activator